MRFVVNQTQAVRSSRQKRRSVPWPVPYQHYHRRNTLTKKPETPEPPETLENPIEDKAVPNLSIIAIQFAGPDSASFMLTIQNVTPWQLTAAAAELTDRAEEARKAFRRKQLQQMATKNLEILQAKHEEGKPKTDD